MKVTWFGGGTTRLHIGGKIFVASAGGMGPQTDGAELLSGADAVIDLEGADLPLLDLGSWRRRRLAREIDGTESQDAALWRIGEGSVLIEAPGEPLVALIGGAAPTFGRWADGAVIVFLREGFAASGAALLDAAQPRLIALAGSDAEVELAVVALRDRLDRAGLVALEIGMGVEV